MAGTTGRGKQPGSVRWREDRHQYEARIRLSNGTRPSAYFDTEKQSWAWIAQKQVDANRGVYASHENRKLTELLNHWLDDVAPKTLSHNSLANYRRCINYLLPYIGTTKIRDLNRAQIEHVLTVLGRSNASSRALAPSTLNLTFRVFKMALEYLVDVEYIARSPMHSMKAPRVAPQNDRVVTMEEAQAILEQAEGTRFHGVFVLLGLTGMRISEVLGLEWKNVDLADGVIRIEHQTARRDGQPGVYLKPLKTESSRRSLPVGQLGCDALRVRADIHAIERKRALKEGSWHEHGLVFCHADGTPYFRSEPEAAMKRIVTTLGMPEITPKTFRHTMATLLQELGFPLKVAQVVLGHSTERMTARVYSHATASALAGVGPALQNVFAARAPEADERLTIPEA